MTGVLNRILVIDDDEDIQEVVQTVLEEVGGYTVEGCLSGTAAVQRAPIFEPDLIVLDMMMPDMDGLTTIGALRTIPGLEQTSVIFLTAQPADASVLQDLPNVIGVITKPFHHRSLVEQLKRLWNIGTPAYSAGQSATRLAAVQQHYLETLRERADYIDALWRIRTLPALQQIYVELHQLAGSGGSLGFAELSTATTALEVAVVACIREGLEWRDDLHNDLTARIDALLAQFHLAVERCSLGFSDA